MALNRIAIPSPNYSSRGGSAVRLIVIHTAEGSKTIESLGSYFASSSSQVSSHAGADDKVNTIGVFVKRADKSWTQGNANPQAVSIELCAFAAWDINEWHRHPNMLQNCATWIAEEAAAFGIPKTMLTAQQAQSNGAGVCQHIDLGSWGGGHVDCGPSFPLSEVMAMAGGQTGAPPQPTPTPPPAVAGTAPPFPYPGDHYLGRPDSDPKCHSGHYGGVDSTNVATWQRQMIARGWDLGPTGADGDYGDNSYNACRSFQGEATNEGHDTGGVDGLCGPKTWALTWTKPVT